MRRLVLVGGGHAHAQLLLSLAKTPLPGVEVVMVSSQTLSPYSGMIPGWLAGLYRFDQIVINFQSLSEAANVRWTQTDLVALDPDAKRLQLSSGETLAYDVLSLNVGSTLTPPRMDNARVLALRPLSSLQTSFDAFLDDWQQDSSRKPFSVTTVGAGAAGFESLLAVVERLRQLRPERPIHGHLINKGDTLLPSLSATARRSAHQALQSAGITLSLNTEWSTPNQQQSQQQSEVTKGVQTPGGCRTADSRDHLVLWATGAEAHPWQRSAATRGSLSVGPQGFIRIDRQLRSVSHPEIFAVGDCAQWETPLPKAGVFAVRMGPILSHNLRAVFGVGALQTFVPQRHFLMLLSTGNGRAIGSRGPFGFQGRWVWSLKNYIDQSFVQRFEVKL